MNDIIALDIALLPPPDIWNWAVALSTTLNKAEKPLIKLDDTHFPHITVVQLFIHARRCDELWQRIASAVKETVPLELTIVGLKTDANNTVSLSIAISRPLLKLYALMMDNTKEFRAGADKNAFALNPGEVARQGTIRWVSNFDAKLRYNPHITLAKNSVRMVTIRPRTFKAGHLAVCHLGNFCTCRKILYEHNFEA